MEKWGLSLGDAGPLAAVDGGFDALAGLEGIEASRHSNRNIGPVVAASTTKVAQLYEKYLGLMHAVPSLALDIFNALTQVFEYYLHAVLCLFVQDRDLRLLLDIFNALTQVFEYYLH